MKPRNVRRMLDYAAAKLYARDVGRAGNVRRWKDLPEETRERYRRMVQYVARVLRSADGAPDGGEAR